MRATSTEVQNNFGKYLALASASEEIIITKNGRDIARMVTCSAADRVEEEFAVYENEDGPRITYEEFIKLTEESEQRYELIDGELFLLASPSYAHQTAVSEIISQFRNFFKGKKCRPLTSPFDVTLVKGDNTKHVVQPDILVICDPENIDQKGRYWGIPSLVVEVLSPSSKKHDMFRKLNLYARTGIKEFWLVDTDKKAVYMYNFDNKVIEEITSFANIQTVKSNIFEGFEISLEEIFE